MKISAAREAIFRLCNTLYEANELEAISGRILEHLSGKEKLALILDKEVTIDAAELYGIIDALKEGIPIQYILGFEWFGSLKLKVNEDVLIPRPETEELTHLLIDKIKTSGNTTCKIIDIGTGSGCIPVLINKEIQSAELYAIDVSEKALFVAKENAVSNNSPVQFMHADILDETLNLHEQFDHIISNPPYILPEEKKDMHTRVFEQEPQLALFVTNDDALEFYRAILFFAQKHLKKEGCIYLEINQQFGAEIKMLYEQANYHCEILKDMYGNERFAVAKQR